MKEKLKKMTNDQLKQRVEELRDIADNPENRSAEELEQLAEERQLIDEVLTERRAEAAREQLRRDNVAGGVVGSNLMASKPVMENRKTYGPDSPEYRSAWLKNMAVREGVHLLGEMNAEEREAWTHTTANTTAVVPTVTMNRNPTTELLTEFKFLKIPSLLHKLYILITDLLSSPISANAALVIVVIVGITTL